jgi:phospholipase/lecithinase/hemolysin
MLRNLSAIVLFFGGLVFSSQAGFSSIYIWGDSLSNTTTNNAGSSAKYYYGQRYSNGRTWVEVLAQRQGLGANSISNVNWSYSSNNVSFYGHYSSSFVTDIKSFNPPPGLANKSLFVVWADNADFVGDMTSFGQPNSGTNQTAWTTAINQHLTNHLNFITSLYAKGARTFVAPNAADITVIPQFNNSGAAYRKFVRQQIISFNASYAAMLNQLQASPNFPGLKIVVPDIYSLLNNVLTNAASFGLTNALYDEKYGNGPTCIDATDAYSLGLLNSAALNGPGTNYIFWDYFGSPTAAMGEVIADFVQQYLSPVQLTGVTQINGNDRLDVVNMPVGLNGFVDGNTNLSPSTWTLATNFNSFTTAQSIFVITPPLPAGFGTGAPTNTGPVDINPGDISTNAVYPPPGTNTFFNVAAQFYRLRFPYAWNWP